MSRTMPIPTARGIRRLHRHRLRKNVVSSAVAIVAIAVLTAGCGTSSNKSQASQGSAAASASGVAQAIADFKQAQKPVSGFTAPGPSFSGKAQSGKTVWYLALSYSDPFFHTVGDALKTALGQVGVNVNICDGKGSPSNITQCMIQAIGAHAGAIIADGLGPSVIGPQLSDAQAQGVPVIEGDLLDPDSPVPPGAAAVVSTPHTMIGKLLGDAVVALSNGKADVYMVSTTDVPSGKLLADDGAIATVKSACPDCKTSLTNVPISQWSSRIQSGVQAALVSDPKIDYVVAGYDSMTPFILPALGTKNIGVITQNANLAEMKNLADGNHVAVEVGSDPNWEGWAYADQALRLMAGQQPVIEKIPVRVFNKDNIKGLSITADAAASQDWYGGPELSTAMQNGFKTLWGVGG